MTNPHPQHPSELHGASDKAIDTRRRTIDQERTVRREVHDRTRQHSRGGRQAQAGLDRERALDDASLEDERSLVDTRRALDRTRAHQESREQGALLEQAEGRLDAAHVEKQATAQEGRHILHTAGAELARLREALVEIQARTVGTVPDLITHIEEAQASAERLTQGLAQALEAVDLRGDHPGVAPVE